MVFLDNRHPSTTGLLRWFDYEHLPPELAEVSSIFATCALNTATVLGDGPELSVALRKLLEGKDAAVRQRITDREAAADRSAAERSGGCEVCGRPFSPDHDADAPGPVVRHPFRSPLNLGPSRARPMVRDTPQA